MSGRQLGVVLGMGHALPAEVRSDDAPCFDVLRAREARFAELFQGHRRRRVLAPEASLAVLMGEACAMALREAGAQARDVRGLLGFASVSEFSAPNELFAVHALLGLGAAVPCYPIADEFTSFLSGLRLAAALAGEGVMLVACGCRWTANVSYEDAVSASIGDGAGAAVLASERSPSARRQLRVLGHEVEVAAGLYGTMRLTPRRDSLPEVQHAAGPLTRPLFYMSEGSRELFLSWGASAPAELGANLLQRLGVPAAEVTMMGHQASQLLLDAWARRIQPAAVADTLPDLGNMTLASLPVTLSVRLAEVPTRYLLLVGLGLGIHAHACLLEVLEGGRLSMDAGF